MSSRKFVLILLPSFTVTTCILVYLRIFFGICLTDEIQYIGSAAIYSMGGQPFVNESYLQQIASLFISPFMDLFVSLRQSFEGIILFSRHLYFIFYFGLFLSFRWTLIRCLQSAESTQNRNPKEAATLGALVFLTYAHNLLPSLCYNTLGTGFLTFSLLALLLGWRELPALDKDKGESSNWKVQSGGFLSGVALTLSIAAYPTLITVPFAMLLFSMPQIAKLKDVRIRSRIFPIFISLFVGILVTTTLLVLWLLHFGLNPLIESWNFTTLFNIGGSWQEKEWFFRYHLHFYSRGWLWAFLIFIASLLLRRWFRFIYLEFVTAAIFTVLMIFNWTPEHPAFVQGLISIAALVGIFWILPWAKAHQSPDPKFKIAGETAQIIKVAVLALISCAPVVGWTSSAVFTALPVVTQVAAAFGIFALATRGTPGLVAAVVIHGLFLFNYGTAFIGDAPWDPSITWVKSGPAAGLFTFREREDFLIEVRKAIVAAEVAGGKTILFVNYPLGYFESKMTPHTRALYIHGLEKPGVVEAHAQYLRDAGAPDFYFELQQYPSSPGRWDDLQKDTRWIGTMRLRAQIVQSGTYVPFLWTPYFGLWKHVPPRQ